MSAAPMPLGPPRMLPMEALFLLGTYSHDDGFVQFLVDCRDDGFTLWEPEDESLDLDEWEDVANRRVRTVVSAWEIFKARENGRTETPEDPRQNGSDRAGGAS